MKIKYLGTAAYQERDLTGYFALWQPGQTTEVEEQYRITKLLTMLGVFADDEEDSGEIPVTSRYNPLTGKVAISADGVSGLSPVVPASAELTAATNRTAIQKALDGAGNVSLTGEGLIYSDLTLLIPSRTAFDVGAGLEIKLADGVNDNFIRNANALAPAITLGAGELTFSGLTATIAHTGIGALYGIGDYFGINGSTTKGFNGVWPVASSSADVITFTLPVAPAAATALGTILVGPADTHISITGLGKINANGAGQTSGANPRKDYGIFLRNARYVTISGISGEQAKQWFICTSNVEDLTINGVKINSNRVLGCDPIHLTGPHRRVLIADLIGYAADNVIGCTVEQAGAFTDVQPGDMYDIKARNINVDSTAAAVGLWGAPGFAIDFDLDGLHGVTTSSGFKTAPFPSQGMTATGGNKLSLKNFTVSTGAESIMIGGGGDWGEIEIEDIATLPDKIAVNCPQTTGTVKKFSIRRLSSVGTRTVAQIQLQNMPFGHLIVGDIHGDNYGSSFMMTGGGNGKSITIEDTNITTTGSMYYAANSGTCDRVVFRNAYQYGAAGAGSMFRQGATSAVKSVIFDSCGGNGLKALFDGANATQTINVAMGNVELTSCARAGIFAGPTFLSVNGYREVGAMTNNPFQALTTAVFYDFSFANVSSLKTDLVGFTAGANLRMRGGFTDGNNVTNPQPGDQFWNTNASMTGSASIGQKARTQAGAWASLF